MIQWNINILLFILNTWLFPGTRGSEKLWYKLSPHSVKTKQNGLRISWVSPVSVPSSWSVEDEGDVLNISQMQNWEFDVQIFLCLWKCVSEQPESWSVEILAENIHPGLGTENFSGNSYLGFLKTSSGWELGFKNSSFFCPQGIVVRHFAPEDFSFPLLNFS